MIDKKVRGARLGFEKKMGQICVPGVGVTLDADYELKRELVVL
jgi:hypothetical protein